MPGRHINDHQMRMYMRLRLTEPVTAAAEPAEAQQRRRCLPEPERGRTSLAEERTAGTASSGPLDGYL